MGWFNHQLENPLKHVARHVEMEPSMDLQALAPKPGGPDGPLKRHGWAAAPSTGAPRGFPTYHPQKWGANKAFIKGN